MSGYIGPIPVPQGIQEKQSFTATASQTTFNTNGYTDGAFINVYLNGVRLINGTDYTATNGSDIVLTTGASASDVLDFETFNSFSLVDQTFDNVTLKNPTHEDTDGGRESAVSFKGEQSGGEISTLAQIQASHDGTSDDQKGDLIFKTNDGSDNDAPTERLRLDSAGRASFSNGSIVTIGNETMGRIAGKVPNTDDFTLAVVGTGFLDSSATLQRFENSSSGPALLLGHSRNGTIGSSTILQNGDELGKIRFFADDGTNMDHYGGEIKVVIDGTPGANDIPSSMVFSTAADGSNSVSNRWKITSEGHFKAMSDGLGIDFSASEGSGATSSILDDYEEGTFTPTYSAASGTITTTSNAGKYVKVGDVVHCHFRLRSSGVSGISGAISIAGFPFVAVNDARSSGSKWFARDWGSDMPNFSFGISGLNTTALLYKHAMNASASSVDNGNFGTGSDDNVLEASITYQVA